MEDKEYVWNDENTVKTEINLREAMKDVYEAKQFHKALFLRIFRPTLEKFQNLTLKMYKAHEANTLMRKLDLISKWMTIGLIAFLAVLRGADIWVNGYQGSKTAFDIGLTMNTMLLLLFLWISGKANRETNLRFSEARKCQSLAEALVRCHQGFLEIMDESGFPKPNLNDK